MIDKQDGELTCKLVDKGVVVSDVRLPRRIRVCVIQGVGHRPSRGHLKVARVLDGSVPTNRSFLGQKPMVWVSAFSVRFRAAPKVFCGDSVSVL